MGIDVEGKLGKSKNNMNYIMENTNDNINMLHFKI